MHPGCNEADDFSNDVSGRVFWSYPFRISD